MSAEGAKAQSRRLEVIANNLANVNTVGFKPDQAAFQARFSEAIQNGESWAGSQTRNDIGGGVKVIETLTDFSPGRLQRTGNDTDMSIIGNGFFQVEGEQGQRLLTRAGAFKLDNVGRLMTANGHRVLDAGGTPIQIDPRLPWTISTDGLVQQAGTGIPLAIVQPSDLNELNKAGDNLFSARNGVQPVPATEREVRQGFLEMSAANPTQQMMAMIETSRAFEANARMIQTQDDASSQLVGRLLRA